jgi:hypothetical protein
MGPVPPNANASANASVKKYGNILNVPLKELPMVKAMENKMRRERQKFAKNIQSGLQGLSSCSVDQQFSAHQLQFFLQMVAASIICSVGFATNSETTVIGSMLISPIGGLIIDWGKGKIRFGSTQEGKVHGSKSLTTKLIFMFTIPFVAGLLTGWLIHKEEKSDDSVAKGRGKVFFENKNLFIGTTLVAVAAGLLFAWDSENTPGIGIGIATALLPPIVATGFALGRSMQRKGNSPQPDDFSAADAGYSFSVFLINFFALLGSTYGFKKLSDSVCHENFDLNSSAADEIGKSNITQIVEDLLKKYGVVKT